MWDVSGVSGAAPIWHEVMDRLQRPAPSRPPAPPAGVVATRVRVKSHREPAWVEYFLAGTEMESAARARGRASRIPARAPWLRSTRTSRPTASASPCGLASAADDTLRWTLDGTALGCAGERVLWAPRPGKHRLALVDARGREADAVSFEVRGSPR